jgi:NAD(P)-dependent dehydrogenase (short-subunit alcohol dehydrogenase family)
VGDRLKGKAAVITGAGSGIGRATAHMMAREGAGVVVADLSGESAETVAKEIKDAGGRAVAVQADVSDVDRNQAMVDAAVDEFGRIDILHNNATLTDPAYIARDMDFLNFDADAFRRMAEVNVIGGLLGCKHALPHMLSQGGGSIIFTSSIASLAGDIGSVSYGATKATINWYVKTIATLFGKRGIRCNAILPGVVKTASQQAWSNPEMDAAYLTVACSPRLGEPDDIAAMALFLASDESKYVNGGLYAVDGGMSCSNPFVLPLRQFIPEPVGAVS